MTTLIWYVLSMYLVLGYTQGCVYLMYDPNASNSNVNDRKAIPIVRSWLLLVNNCLNKLMDKDGS